MSKTDRIIRGILSAIFLIAFLFTQGVWSIVLAALSIVLGLTAISGVCPIYKMFQKG